MILIKQSLTLHILVLCYILSLSNALHCKVCVKDDRACLFGQNFERRRCENDDDICYTWFHRNGSDISVQRDCISIASPEYSLIKDVIGDTNSRCVKRIRTLDCFSFCSNDLCN